MYINYYDMSMFSEPSFYIGTIIFSVIAYLIGSINGGQILSLIGTKDLGEEGSKNFGATNAGRLYGAKGFAAVFIFDMLKAVFAALILELILTQGTMSFDVWQSHPDYFFYYASIPLAMMFLVIGHSFPIYFGFKGGKGVASVFGCVIVLNWVFAIISIAIFGITIAITRWTAWGSIIGTITGVVLVIFAQAAFYDACGIVLFFWSYSWLNIIAATFLGLFITIRHKENLIRMFTGVDPIIKPKGWKRPEENELDEKTTDTQGKE